MTTYFEEHTFNALLRITSFSPFRNLSIYMLNLHCCNKMVSVAKVTSANPHAKKTQQWAKKEKPNQENSVLGYELAQPHVHHTNTGTKHLLERKTKTPLQAKRAPQAQHRGTTDKGRQQGHHTPRTTNEDN